MPCDEPGRAAHAFFGEFVQELFDQAGAGISTWRESYTLALRDGQYKITTSIDH
jgi:hypothetical protein